MPAIDSGPDSDSDTQGSTYVPMDSWIYPALDRLHGLGYVDSAFLDLRPWTRLSIAHMLELSADQIESGTNNDEARAIYQAVLKEVKPDLDRTSTLQRPSTKLESVYTDIRGIGGTPLRDSFHLGQTIINDYGRPYESGFNNSTGFSARAEAGRFSLYFRGEVQHAPSATGYSPTLAAFSRNIGRRYPVRDQPAAGHDSRRPDRSGQRLRASWKPISPTICSVTKSLWAKIDHWLGPDKGAVDAMEQQCRKHLRL